MVWQKELTDIFDNPRVKVMPDMSEDYVKLR